MSYDYVCCRSWLFTDEGQRVFLKARDHAKELLKKAGAFKMGSAMAGFSAGDTDHAMACIDRMVELGEIVELPRECWGQYRVFTTAEVHNR